MGLRDVFRSETEVHHIGDHEVVEHVEYGLHAVDRYMKCRRCGETKNFFGEWEEKFRNIDCHDCDCIHCDV